MCFILFLSLSLSVCLSVSPLRPYLPPPRPEPAKSELGGGWEEGGEGEKRGRLGGGLHGFLRALAAVSI